MESGPEPKPTFEQLLERLGGMELTLSDISGRLAMLTEDVQVILNRQGTPGAGSHYTSGGPAPVSSYQPSNLHKPYPAHQPSYNPYNAQQEDKCQAFPVQTRCSNPIPESFVSQKGKNCTRCKRCEGLMSVR